MSWKIIALTYHVFCHTNVLNDVLISPCSSLNLLNNFIWVISNICFAWFSYQFNAIVHHISSLWTRFMCHSFNTFSKSNFVWFPTNNCLIIKVIICIFLQSEFVMFVQCFLWGSHCFCHMFCKIVCCNRWTNLYV